MIRQIFMPWRWAELFSSWTEFAYAFLTTLQVAFFALLLALAIGAVSGVMSASRPKVLRAISRIYVEFFQNTPLAIQVFFVYYALPYTGIVLYEVPIGILCVGLYTGAYISQQVQKLGTKAA